MSQLDMSFFKDKRVLITGHTGFKGSWMCRLLAMAGAQVTGYALQPPTEPSLYRLGGVEQLIRSEIGDVRDLAHMKQVFEQARPEIVIHMAAQPLVRDSYKDPVSTYEINVMGTVHVLECVRTTPGVRSFLNVTTDKVYHNREWQWGYRENEELNGYDPYSNSKSCSELVTSSYKKSFFSDGGTAISTARAGNVIGGGDFAADRIIPDCVRAAEAGREIIVRNPYSTRPYQHVLEPIAAYLMIVRAQWEDPSFADSYNVGPEESDCYTTGGLVTLFCDKWNQQTGQALSTGKKLLSWRNEYDGGPHEANFLKLDCSKIKDRLNWRPRYHVESSMDKIVEWTRVYFDGGDVAACMDRQIREFLSLFAAF